MPDVKNLNENWNIFFYSDKEYDEQKYRFVKDLCQNYGEYLKVAGVDC